MNSEQKAQILDALHHGFPADPDFENILDDDVKVLEPLVDAWLIDARDFFFAWAQHKHDCNITDQPLNAEACSCGLVQAIRKRRTVCD